MTGDFYGLPTRTLSNAHLRLEFLAAAGPRIVRLSLAGSNENLLVEVPDMHWPTPYGEYYLRGGHRLWHAPEAVPRSSVPDNSGLAIVERDGAVCLIGPLEAGTRIRKSIEIRLHDDRPAVTVRHELWNGSAWAVELAPWAITQLPLGGVAILPQQTEPLDGDGVVPNRHLVLWPYTRWHDPRLCLGDEHVLIEARREASAFKIGYMNHHGWVGYLRAGSLFIKRFQPQPNAWHADLGCNAEVYCNERFIELETLAPLCRVEPGQSCAHIETWEIFADVSSVPDDVQTVWRKLKSS